MFVKRHNTQSFALGFFVHGDLSYRLFWPSWVMHYWTKFYFCWIYSHFPSALFPFDWTKKVIFWRVFHFDDCTLYISAEWSQHLVYGKSVYSPLTLWFLYQIFYISLIYCTMKNRCSLISLQLSFRFFTISPLILDILSILDLMSN
jgi:hypothetical protein